MCETKPESGRRPRLDDDPEETQEWLDSLEDVLYRWGPERVAFLMERLEERARTRSVPVPFQRATPAVNTIPAHAQPDFPGDLELEQRFEDLCRWNSVAMVVGANKRHEGLGGHLSTYASSATLYETGFNHFFRGADGEGSGDQVFIQGHGSPGIYARAFMEGRLSEELVKHFRQEGAPGGGLPSYPHPWLLPDFWQFPTVSMGLGPLQAIYQARFNRYLHHRGIADTSESRVWAFLGDGETDEPEAKGAIDIASRDGLDNLIFVINCNLQRLDGPVRGNDSIVHDLEGIFRGAGWRVIKVLWDSAWDDLFARDEEGHLARALGELVDGELQRLATLPGSAWRSELFGKSAELKQLIEGWSDADLHRLGRGGLDRKKVFAAYDLATRPDGRPTVVLAHTIKGWGLGDAVQGANSTHQQKKLKDPALLELRDRLEIPLDDDAADDPQLYNPGPDSEVVKYVLARREALGGPLPARREECDTLVVPELNEFAEFLGGSDGRPASTTMSFVRILAQLMRHDDLGKRIVPIIPDEARTFGMDPFFRQFGIYSPVGQRYEPVDKKTVLYYREARDGQVLEEGITEAGATSSFIAAGSAYATHGVNMVPFYTFYSMFGFQRVADSIWAAGDQRCRGFLLGATAGRTTLNGEGLQHQDGHGLLIASAFPHVRAYEPAYAYEIAALIADGLDRMVVQGEPVIYYITLQNENYEMPALEGDRATTARAIVDGLHRLRQGEGDGPRVQLFGSGSILLQVLRAAEILREQFEVESDVWSATSYKQLRVDAMAAERWNRLHPNESPRSCHLWEVLDGVEGPFVAASDNVALVPEQIAPWISGTYTVLGTDGFGRSDTRERLRRHFEIDAESIAVAALGALAKDGAVGPSVVSHAIETLGIDPEQPDSQLA